MHDVLYEHQHALELDNLVRHAAMLNLNVDRFARELATGVYAPRVRQHFMQHFMSGARSGVNGTPSVIINGRRHDDS